MYAIRAATNKGKEHPRRLEQGRQEICTRLQQTMRNGAIQIQIIPPTEEMQPVPKQSKLKPDTNRLHLPTRIRAAKSKIRKRAMRKKRHEEQISQPEEMSTEKKTADQKMQKQTLRGKADQCEEKRWIETPQNKKSRSGIFHT